MAIKSRKLTEYEMYTRKKYQKMMTGKVLSGEQMNEKEKRIFGKARWEMQHDSIMGTDDYETRNAPDYNKQPESSKPLSAEEKKSLEGLRKIGESYQKRMVGRKK